MFIGEYSPIITLPSANNCQIYISANFSCVERFSKSAQLFRSGAKLLKKFQFLVVFHRFIATALFRMVKRWLHSSGNLFEWPLIWMLAVKYKIWLLSNSCAGYVARKVLRTSLFLWGHELDNSLRLFKLQRFFLQIIMNFSWRHRLHFLLIL